MVAGSMKAWLLIVTLHGMAPQQATPVRYASYDDCKKVVDVLALTKTSSTVYDCVPA